MIGILLNDTAYEQDIRELLMAFYPGETFVHEKQDDGILREGTALTERHDDEWLEDHGSGGHCRR